MGAEGEPAGGAPAHDRAGRRRESRRRRPLAPIHRLLLSVRGTDMHSARGGPDAPTRPQPGGGPAPGGSLVPQARAPYGGEPHDMRRKRPPALAFVLRMDTLRRVARVASLLALDFLGLFLA